MSELLVTNRSACNNRRGGSGECRSGGATYEVVINESGSGCLESSEFGIGRGVEEGRMVAVLRHKGSWGRDDVDRRASIALAVEEGRVGCRTGSVVTQTFERHRCVETQRGRDWGGRWTRNG